MAKRINAKYSNGQQLEFMFGETVTIIKAVDIVYLRKPSQTLEVGMYQVMYNNEEYYATDEGLGSRNPDIFKRVIAGIGYRGKIDINNFKKEYRLWKDIIYRCYNPNSNLYCMYGGKGVRVHPKWLCFECFMYDLVNFANYASFRDAQKSYELDIDYKQNKVPMDQRVYGPDLTSLRPYYSTDVSRSHILLRQLGKETPVASIDESIPKGKKKPSVDDFKPDKFGNWPDEAYQAVIDNPPKLLVPDADTNLPIGAVRVLNGVIYTNRPLLTSVINPDGYFGAKRAMTFEDYFNNDSSNKNESSNGNKVMCVIVDNKSARNK